MKGLSIIDLLIASKTVVFFYYFQYGFISHRSTAILLPVAPDRIGKDFDRSRVTEAVALDITKVLERV